jgi:glycosyltransferase involved in cell wall biosynthesis
MRRVAQVITRFIAGAGGVALRGAMALDPDRYSVTILSAAGGPLLAEAEKAGFEVVRLSHMRPEFSLREDPKALLELIAELRNGHFDIVHTHSSKAGAWGRIAAHRVGVPAIVHTFHGFPFHNFQSWPLRATYVEVEKRLGRITDQFLAVGGAVAAQAISLKIAPAERIRAIASAIEIDIPQVSESSRIAARRLLGLPEDAMVIGTVGRLAPQKAPHDMVAAVEAMGRRDVYFVWVGGGPLLEATRRLIERRGLAGRFLLLGERRDVGALLPAFDVFALASLYEGLPCSIVEAMTCGVPVVATAVNAVPEVVVAGRTGLLVPPGAPKLLGKALAYLLDHPDEGARMAHAARTQLGDRFHPAVLGRDLAETYELALNGSKPAVTRRLGLVAHA